MYSGVLIFKNTSYTSHTASENTTAAVKYPSKAANYKLQWKEVEIVYDPFY